MKDDSREFMAWVDALAKGVIAGAALGYLFSFTGMIPAAKAVALGGMCGALASITYKNKRDDMRAAKKAEMAAKKQAEPKPMTKAEKKAERKARKKADKK